VGQSRAVSLAHGFVKQAVAEGRACRPLLLVAPRGFGKTFFARAVARITDTCGANLHELFAAEEASIELVRKKLLDLKFADFFFIDEAHALSMAAQRLLHRAIDEFVVIMEDGSAKEIAELSLVLASTQTGLISADLRSPLKARESDICSQEELTEIAKQDADERGLDLKAQGAREIAIRSQGTPRIARDLVSLLPDVLGSKREYGVSEVRKMLEALGIDPLGLTELQRRYLVVLASSPRHACFFSHLKARLGIDPDYLREEVETYLFRMAFVDSQGGRGRYLTENGKAAVEHLRSLGWFKSEGKR